jgi:hypothetical protein
MATTNSVSYSPLQMSLSKVVASPTVHNLALLTQFFYQYIDPLEGDLRVLHDEFLTLSKSIRGCLIRGSLIEAEEQEQQLRDLTEKLNLILDKKICIISINCISDSKSKKQLHDLAEKSNSIANFAKFENEYRVFHPDDTKEIITIIGRGKKGIAISDELRLAISRYIEACFHFNELDYSKHFYKLLEKSEVNALINSYWINCSKITRKFDAHDFEILRGKKVKVPMDQKDTLTYQGIPFKENGQGEAQFIEYNFIDNPKDVREFIGEYKHLLSTIEWFKDEWNMERIHGFYDNDVLRQKIEKSFAGNFYYIRLGLSKPTVVLSIKQGKELCTRSPEICYRNDKKLEMATCPYQQIPWINYVFTIPTFKTNKTTVASPYLTELFEEQLKQYNTCVAVTHSKLNGCLENTEHNWKSKDSYIQSWSRIGRAEVYNLRATLSDTTKRDQYKSFIWNNLPWESRLIHCRKELSVMQIIQLLLMFQEDLMLDRESLPCLDALMSYKWLDEHVEEIDEALMKRISFGKSTIPPPDHQWSHIKKVDDQYTVFCAFKIDKAARLRYLKGLHVFTILDLRGYLNHDNNKSAFFSDDEWNAIYMKLDNVISKKCAEEQAALTNK